jgi:hypothetical protein
MKKKLLFIPLFLLGYILIPGIVKAQPITGKYRRPWMFYDSSQFDGIREKVKQSPYSKVYKSLSSNAVLRFIVDGDKNVGNYMHDVIYKKLMTARKYMDIKDQNDSRYFDPLQWGRRIQEWVTAIEPVLGSKYFTEEERNALMKSCDSIAYKLRDGNYVENTSGNNRAMDELMGVAYAGCFLFPENPHADDHYKYVKKKMKLFLGAVQQDGTWPESPRYVSVVLRCLTLFAFVQKRYDPEGKDLVLNDPLFHSILKTFAETVTCPDALNHLAIETPGVGDASWSNEDLGVVSFAAFQMKDINPALYALLYNTWYRSGKVYFWPSQLLPYVDENALIPEVRPASMILPDAGHFLSRNNVGKTNESFFLVHAPMKHFEHYHPDAGSFSLYARQTPFMLDPAATKYELPEHRTWFKSTPAHNIVSFKQSNGKDYQNIYLGKQVIDTLLSNQLDLFQLDLTPSRTKDSKYATKHMRTLAAIKSPQDIYIIYDYIESSNSCTNNLHYFSYATEIDKRNGINHTISHGYNNMDVETYHVWPPDGNIKIDKGQIDDVPSSWPHNLADMSDAVDKKKLYQQWLKIDNTGSKLFLTIIFPKDRLGNDSINVEALVNENSSYGAYKIKVKDSAEYVVIVNKTGVSQPWKIAYTKEVRGLRGAGNIVPVSDTLSSTIEAATFSIYQKVPPPVVDDNKPHDNPPDNNPPDNNPKDDGQTVGIEEKNVLETVVVYPNPAHHSLHMEVPHENGFYHLQIIDATGSIIQDEILQATEHIILTDVSDLSKGLYYLILQNNTGKITRKLIIQ